MDTRIGFELECLHPLNHSDFQKSIKKSLGFNVKNVHSFYKEWLLTTDGSLDPSFGKPAHPHELVSPIMPLELALENMKQTFDWLENTGGYTNKTTGFHIGVSFNDTPLFKKLDILKLLVLLNHSDILRKYDRTRSSYCRNLMVETLSVIRRKAINWNEIKSNEWKKMSLEERVRHCIPKEKMTTVNLSKLAIENPYVEFRAIGGENYHLRFDDIKETINHYIDVLESSVKPEKDIEKFIRRKEMFLADVEEVLIKERKRHEKVIEERRVIEEKRIQILLDRDIARRAMRFASVKLAA